MIPYLIVVIQCAILLGVVVDREFARGAIMIYIFIETPPPARNRFHIQALK